MGHGWKTIGSRIISSEPCKCGKGRITVIVDLEESDYPPFERESVSYTQNNCPDKCN